MVTEPQEQENKIYAILMGNASLHPDLDPDGAMWQRMVAAGMITRTNLAVTRTLDTALRPLGITFSRHQVLSSIYHRGAEGIPLSRIAEQLFVHPTTITGTVTRLVNDGHVERHQLPGDRRTHYAVATPEGRGLYERSSERLHEFGYGFVDVDTDDLKRLNELLSSMIDGTVRSLAQILGSESMNGDS